MRVLQRTIAGTGALALALLISPAAPAAAQSAPNGAFADAFGLQVDVTALAGTIPVETGEISDASSSCPPATGPDSDEVLDVTLPDDGRVATSDTLMTGARTDCSVPSASARARAEGVTVLTPVAGGPSLFSAETIDANASATCEGLVGTTDFVGLTLTNPNNPTQVLDVPADPAPNTRIDIPGVATVILNEQTFDLNADGSGGTITVNGVHIIGASDLLRGEIIISHAVAGVTGCAPGSITPPADVEDPNFDLTKTATPATAEPGDTVTYTATFANNTDADCDVLQAIDHLSPAFSFVSTSGDFGTASEREQRSDGGTDVILSPTDVVIAPGASATQTFVVRVKPTTGPGTYFNVTELRCSQQGNVVSPPTAPVRVVTQAQPPAEPPQVQPEPRALPRTGGAPVLALGALVLLGGALVARRSFQH